MLNITAEGRKKQEFQLKLQSMLQGHFQHTEDLDGGKMKIGMSESFQSYLTLDLHKASSGKSDFIVSRWLDGQEISHPCELSTLSALDHAVTELVERAQETEVPCGISKCLH